MSRDELQIDQKNVYNALLRLIEAERTQSQAFRKLVARLEWVNTEMIKQGYLDTTMNDAGTIRQAWL